MGGIWRRALSVIMSAVLLATAVPLPAGAEGRKADVPQAVSETEQETERERKQVISVELHPASSEFERWSWENLYFDYFRDATATITYDDGSCETISYDEYDSMGNCISDCGILHEDGSEVVSLPEEGSYLLTCKVGEVTAYCPVRIRDNFDELQKLVAGDQTQEANADGVYIYEYTADISRVVQLFAYGVDVYDETMGERVYPVYQSGCSSFKADKGHSFVIALREEPYLYAELPPAPVSIRCINEEDFHRIPASFSHYREYDIFLETTYSDGTSEVCLYHTYNGSMEESDTYTYNYQVSSGFYQGEEEADMQSAAEGDYALKIYCDYLLYKMALPPTRSLEEKKAQAEDDGIGLILSIPVQALDKDSPLWNVSTDTEIVQNEGLRFYRFPISEEGTYAITAGETGTAEGYVEFGTGDEWSYGGRVSSEDASGISLRKGDVLYVSMKMYGEEGKGTEQGSFRLERVGDLERKSFAVSEPEDVMYSEGWQFPSVTVTDQESGKKLKEGKDYTLFASLDTSVRDEDSIGTIRITVTGKANYVEEKEVTCRLLKKNLQDLTISSLESQIFTGASITPSVTVKNGAVLLEEEKDYTVQWENNVHAGTASVTLIGQGNYTGAVTKRFQITAADVSTAAQIEELPVQEYTGYDIRPAVTVKRSGMALTAGKDYEVSYSDNRDPGSQACVTITGIGDYKGSVKKKFVIEESPISMSGLQITALTEGEKRELSFGAGCEGQWFSYEAPEAGLYSFQGYGGGSAWRDADAYREEGGFLVRRETMQSAAPVRSYRFCLPVFLESGERIYFRTYGQETNYPVILTAAREHTGENWNFNDGARIYYGVFTADREGKYTISRVRGQMTALGLKLYDQAGTLLAEGGGEVGVALEKGESIYLEAEVSSSSAEASLAWAPLLREIQPEKAQKVFAEGIDTGYLAGLRLHLSYGDGTEQTLEAGNLTDSYGYTVKPQILDENGTAHGTLEHLAAGTYTVLLSCEGKTAQYVFNVVPLTQIDAELLKFDSNGHAFLSFAGNEKCSSYYKFTAEENGDYAFDLSKSGSLELYCENTDLCAMQVFNGKSRVTLEPGAYYLRVRMDGAGETELAALRTECKVPGPISGLTAAGAAGSVVLSWAIGAEADITGYRLYRRNEGETEFAVLADIDKRNVLSYRDQNVEEDITYEYCIAGINLFGRIGAQSVPVKGTSGKDTEPPVITKLEPAEGTLVGTTCRFTAYAQDNVSVARMALYVSEDGKSWKEIASAVRAQVSVDYDTSVHGDRGLKIRAIAYDEAGNQSAELIQSYPSDNTGPSQVLGVTASSASVKVTLHWEALLEKDLFYYRVEEKRGQEFVKITDTYQKLGAVVEGLTPDTAYVYRVVGYDRLGNRGVPSKEITVKTTKDTTSPVITGLNPKPGAYREQIPVSIQAWDDAGVRQLTLQVTDRQGQWEDVRIWNYAGIQGTTTQEYTLELADRPEGKIRVRAVARDAAGNVSDTGSSAPFVEYVVDRTAPRPPQKVSADGKDGYMEIRWSQGKEDDLAGYTVYRSNAETGSYEKLAEGLKAINYIDRDVRTGVSYRYRVTACDNAGNESAPAQTEPAAVQEDSQAPEIVSIYPRSETILGGGLRTVSVLARDNRSLRKIFGEYKVGAAGSWKSLGQKECSAYRETAVWDIPADVMEEGESLYIRAKAADQAGLESEWTEVSYAVDLTAPMLVNPAAVYDEEQEQAVITWEGMGEADAGSYQIYRKAGDQKEVFLGQLAAEEEPQSYFFTDSGLSVEEITYFYYIKAVDLCGNESSVFAGSVALKDRSGPVPVLNCESDMAVGVEYWIDASDSTDNKDIASFELDLGDGTVTKSSDIVHAYQETGTYTITLTVVDSDGNEAQLKKTVTVEQHQAVGNVKVQAVDEEGRPLSGAEVWFDMGEENQFIRRTDQNGYAVLAGKAGNHAVGCIAADNEHLPVKKEVLIQAGEEIVVRFVLVRQSIVEGSFEVHPMTFEEIEDAGLDMSDPENQYVMQVTVTLDFSEHSYAPVEVEMVYNPTTGKTTLSGDTVVSFPDGTRHELRPTVLSGEKTEDMDKAGEGSLMLAILDIPVSLYTMKEFFDVKLHIINNAPEEVSLTDNRIQLNLPKGVSVVKGGEGSAQSTLAEIPEIKGRSTETVRWILRGDEQGDYSLSADYSGRLEAFDRQVSARFETENPIQVRGLEGLCMSLYMANALKKGMLYYDIWLENKGENPVFRPVLDTQGTLLEIWLYQAGSLTPAQIEELPDTLEPGQRLLLHYEQDTRGVLSYKYLNDYMQAFSEEMSNSYGGECQLIFRPVSYFPAAEDRYTVKFNSQGGTEVADITGVHKGASIRLPEEPKKEGMYFNGWFSFMQGEGEQLTVGTKIMGDTTWYACWGTEKGTLTTTVKKLTGDNYGIHVKDREGNPIAGATVELGNETHVTDESGDAMFDHPQTEEEALLIYKSGYMTYIEENHLRKSSMAEMVTLYTAAQEVYAIKKAYYNGPADTDLNLVEDSRRLTTDNAEDFSITLELPDDGGQVKRYELWQDNNRIGTFTEGKLEGLKAGRFKEGKGIHVRAWYDNQGEEDFVRTTLNLVIVAPPKVEGSLSVGDSISATVADDVPVLGGGNFKVSMPKLPVTAKLSGDGGGTTVHIGFNLNDTLMTKEDRIKEARDFVMNMGQLKRAGRVSVGTINEQIREYQKSGQKMQIFGFDKNPPQVDVIGYAEAKLGFDGKLKSAKGYICVQVEASASFTWPTVVVVVPVTVDVTGNLKGDVDAAFVYDMEKNQLLGDVKLNINVGMDVFMGAGFGIAAGGVYGGLSLAVEVQLASIGGQDPGVNYADLTGEVGLRAYAGPFEYKKKWAHRTWNLYNRRDWKGRTVRSTRTSGDDPYNIEEYTSVDRSYLKNRSVWDGEMTETKDASDNRVHALQTGVWGQAGPKAVTAGDCTLMVFNQDDGTRTAGNIGQLVYSVYEDGKWSSPKPVDDNGRSDGAFCLTTDGEDIYLAYQESNKVFGQGELTVEDYTLAQGIVTAKYNQNMKCFEKPQALTDTEETVYHSMPRMLAVGGKQYILWAENTQNDYFNRNSSNRLVMRTVENGTPGEPEILLQDQNCILELQVGLLGGVPVAVYLQDQDNDLNTAEDRELYVLPLTGEESVKAAQGAVSGLRIGAFPGEEGNVLSWLSNGEIFVMKTAKDRPVNLLQNTGILVSDDYQTLGDHIYFTEGGEEGSDIYRITRKEDGSFTAPVALTDQETYLSGLQLLTLDGQICGLVLETCMDADNGEMEDSLSWIWLDEVRDLVLAGTDFSDEQVTVGAPLPVRLTIWNKGSSQVSGIRYEVRDSQNRTVADGTQALNLDPGAQGSMEISVPLGESLENGAYSIEIWEENGGRVYEETNKGDNQAQIFVSSGDLALEAKLSQTGKDTQLTVLVENRGRVPAGGQVKIYNEENASAHQKVVDISTLEPGEKEAFQISLQEDFFENPGEEEAVTAEVVSDVEDVALQNNRETILVQLNYSAVYYENGSRTAVDFYSKGEELLLPEPVNKENFLGWYMLNKEGMETLLDEGYQVTEDLEIYAKYKKPVCQVTMIGGEIRECRDVSELKELLPKASAVTVVSDVRLDENITVPFGVTFRISAGAAVTVGKKTQMTVEGTLENEGTLNVEGILVNSGNLYNNGNLNAVGGILKGTGILIAGEGSRVTGNVSCEISTHVHRFSNNYTVDSQATLWSEGEKSRRCTVAGCQARVDVQKIARLTPVISLNVKSLPLKVKQSTKAVKVTRMTGGDAIASWKSSAPRIASVSKSGTIKGKKAGKAKITVTLKSGISASVTVKVQKKAVATSKIAVLPKNVKLKVRKKIKLTAAVTPLTSLQKISYVTSNKKVAAVTKKGVVKGVRPGKAKITVRSGKKKAVVKVTVTK